MEARLQRRSPRKKVPYGIRFFQWLGKDRNRLYRGHALLLTFLAYMTYHLSRKPISVIKGSLTGNCTQHDIKSVASLSHLYPKPYSNMTSIKNTCPGWAPFDTSDSKELLGALDLGFLFAYAIGMFVSGYLAEHMDLRIFLSGGMMISGIFTLLFGLGYFWKIHNLAFFLTMQIFAGFFQSTGWPSVVECVGNWFGKGRRGLIMGIWNSHTSFGNIAGSAIAGVWAGHQWGYSFVVPALIIMGMSVIVFLFLVVDPLHVGCLPPNHHVDKNDRVVTRIPNEEDPEEAGLLSSCPEGSYANSESIGYSNSIALKKGSEHGADSEAISFWKALLIPGVVEYSLCLFFAKLVSYTFLYWLPFYLKNTRIGGVKYDAEASADLSIFFDVGGILGGIIAGVISDKTNCSGITVVVMLLLAGPMLFIYRFLANSSIGINIALMSLSGLLVNGPYALITTAVSANLGTHECLQGHTKAMATVTAIIDGTGSFGAALGPLLTGIISTTGWNNVYFMLIAADLGAAVFLSRQVWFELKTILPCLKPRGPMRPTRISVAESVFHGNLSR